MSQLPIPFVSPEIEYAVGSSSAGPFVVPFSFYDEDDVAASYVDSNGTLVELAHTTDFTFTTLNSADDGYTGGEITLVAAVANVTLKIYRSSVIDRLTNWPITGPFDIALLNKDLNKITHVLQELAELKGTYLHLAESATSESPFDCDGKAVCNAGESAVGACLATNRQVDANGPNWLHSSDAEAAVGTEDQWNTIITQSAIVIEGDDNDKLFDLMSQFFAMVQNRNGAEASFYVRMRYQVDCYSQQSKIFNSSYTIKVPATSSIPLSLTDMAEDIDYTNGNCTLSVAVDIYPVGASSADLYVQGANIAVNTSEPR